MNKKTVLKRLCSVSSGLTSSMKYEMLKKAKDYALENELEFPAESQKELSNAAKETLGLAIEFSLGNSSFK